jgi:hypothetical protein
MPILLSSNVLPTTPYGIESNGTARDRHDGGVDPV